MNESRRDDIHIAVPGKRNTYTGIECCCQGIVYCNEALSLSHSLLLESDKDRTQAREGEKKKRPMRVVKQKRKKSSRRERKTTRTILRRVVPLLHPDILFSSSSCLRRDYYCNQRCIASELFAV